ncbi:uncharacterized protein [Prorops nasuta]|uniref:uncharacterized protein n=1 Tax=Prorops nasuta TaxID=863751 RepID=UPI0034CFC79A
MSLKKAIGGSIHRIREFDLEKVNLVDEFDILQIVGEGWFGKILLTEHKSTQTEMVLKALPKAYTSISDFFREFHYGLHLSAHRNIITTYDVAFETAGFYVFSQEYAPLGDLTSNVTETGLGELHAKRVARQLAAAIHHIHSRELVHRDIKLDNILVFKSDFSRIKLCDFGETRRVNTIVRRHNEWLPYSPPEVLQINTDVTYKALTSHDVWQFGIVLFVCLTGCLPWQKAALDDPRYARYLNWHNATLNIAKKPKLFQLISSRAQRMFKRLLDPKAEKRPTSVLEINKYQEDRWLAKLGVEKALNGGADERDELCPSMYSFHSSLEEKNQLLYTLTTYGIETTVDRSRKKDRIREWIQSSAIVEENEEESEEGEEVGFDERDDEEPPSMKGRHFPEMRPSVKRADAKKKNVPNATTKKQQRQPSKPIERKIPFAPQVAEERETVARFASFPNGDPTLALANASNATSKPINSTDYSSAPVVKITGDSTVSEINSMKYANGKLKNFTRNNEVSPEDSIPVASAANNNFNSTFPTTNNGGESMQSGRVIPTSPQAPSRKHRSQTAAFSAAGSAGLNGNRVEPTKRSQSAASLPASTAESPANLPVSHLDGQSPALRMDNQSGVTLAATRLENQSSFLSDQKENTPPELSRAPSVPLTGASHHLLMQNFVSVQGINTTLSSVPPSLAASSSSSSSCSPGQEPISGSALMYTPAVPAPTQIPETVTTTENDRRAPVQNSTTNPSRSASRSSPKKTTPNSAPPSIKPNRRFDDQSNFAYGKDVYEHYGIAQGVIFRAESAKRSSSNSRSGSRSVSN